LLLLYLLEVAGEREREAFREAARRLPPAACRFGSLVRWWRERRVRFSGGGGGGGAVAAFFFDLKISRRRGSPAPSANVTSSSIPFKLSCNSHPIIL